MRGWSEEKEGSRADCETHLLLQMVPHACHWLPVQACVRGHQHLWMGGATSLSSPSGTYWMLPQPSPSQAELQNL